MKKLKKIWLVGLVCFPLLLFGQSVPEEASDEAVLENEMTAPKLSRAQLENFNQRAIQKVEDFADVLTLLGDEKLDMNFRAEVVKAGFDFFWKEEVGIEWYDLKTGKKIDLPLSSFFESTTKIIDGSKVRFLEITGLTPIDCGAPRCEWELNFLVHQKSERAGSISVPASMNIVLEKREKYFGEKNKEVWEVFLGEIKIRLDKP